jgi:GT2 family glycosyltransferase
MPAPVIGYFGAIAEWIDLALIAEVAKLRPQYSFVLVGKVFDRDISALQALPNVFLLGHKEYSEMPALLRGFDVCTIPFVVNQVTNATDPVKLYEYFSQGKPVVATDMKELRTFSELLYLATGPAEFALKLDLALAESGGDRARQRVEFAARNTWADRVERLDAAISGSFPLVSIVIVTYNSIEFIEPCLNSIRQHTTYPHYEVILLDNGSTDGTPEFVRRYAQAHAGVRFISSDQNHGFAAGNNAAIAESRGEYLILLNPDTIVTSGWVGRLLAHFRRDESIGVLGPVTNSAGNELKINVSYRNAPEMERFAEEVCQSHRGEAFDLHVVPLFCAMIPRGVWDSVGALDEGYEIGMFEDDDFAQRIRQAGFRVAGARDCFIHHFGQGSFSKLTPVQYDAIFERNRRRYEKKWRTAWQPHKLADGVHPEDRRFDPRIFCPPEHD